MSMIIYKLPAAFRSQGFDARSWSSVWVSASRQLISASGRAVVAARRNPEAEVTIAMVGKYVDLRDSYISLTESLHACRDQDAHQGPHPLHRVAGP
jgi:CTP synthase